MKVLHVYKTYFPDSFGGVEHFIRTLTHASAKQGVQNTVLTTSVNPEASSSQHQQIDAFTENSVKIVRGKTTFSAASCPISANLLKIFKNEAKTADIIHIHFPWPYADLLTTLFASNKPILLTYHSDIVRQRLTKIIYSPLMRVFLHKVKKIIVTSPHLLNSSEVLQRYQNKCQVIPLAIDDSHYPEPSNALFEKWRNKVGDNFLLFIGQFRHYKGIDVLLNALKKVNVSTVLLGGGSKENFLQGIAESLALKKVHFVGSLSDEDKVALLKLCRAVVLPSTQRTEAFGIALLEGMAYDKPLISTELQSGTSYVNQQGVTGFVVPPKDPVALATAINTLFSDDMLTKKMGAAAKQRYLELFQLNKIVQQYIAAYAKVLN